MQILNGDCLTLMRDMPANSIDSIVTSPPYAMQRKNQYGGIPEHEYPDWTVRWMAEALRVLKPEGSLVLNIREHVRDGQMSDYVHKTRLAIRDSGWYEWDELIWQKTNPAPLGNPIRPRRAWERLLWFGKQRHGHCYPKAQGKPTDNAGRCSRGGEWVDPVRGKPLQKGVARVTDIFTSSVSSAGIHPAAFPPDLAAWCIHLITPPGGTILDPFNGSGSTGVAAVREGFNYIGCELDPEYVEISRARIEAEAKNAGLWAN